MCNKVGKLIAVLVAIVQTIGDGAFFFFLIYSGFENPTAWRIAVSVISLLCGNAGFLLLIFCFRGKLPRISDAMYGSRLELFLLSLTLIALSIVLQKPRLI